MRRACWARRRRQAAAAAQDNELEVWPPVGGERIDLTGHYARMQARGYGYGPLFQGLVEAWRVGDAVYGRAVLAEALWPSAESFRLASGALGQRAACAEF